MWPIQQEFSEKSIKNQEWGSAYIKIRCNECRKPLKSQCNTKHEDGQIFCLECWWELYGKKKLIELKKLHIEDWSHE